MTNWPQFRKTQKQKKETKPKPTNPSSPVRTAHMSVQLRTNVVHNTAQNSSNNLPSYPPIIIARIIVYWRIRVQH